MEMYGMFAHIMTHDEFQHFINPTNEIGQLLQAHFVAVQILLSPITAREMGDRKPEKPSNESKRWLGAILDRVSPQMQEFFEWPTYVAKGVETGSFYTELSDECSDDSPDTLHGDEDMGQTMHIEI
jgi:hypothetical protein